MKRNLNKIILSALMLVAFNAGAQTYLIKTVAGNGNTTPLGDGGHATAATLNTPEGVTADDSGNIYIADKTNNRIRKVNVAGTISTVAGNGTGGYTGDGASAVAAELSLPTSVAKDKFGNLYIADFHNAVIRKVNTSGIISTFAGGATSATAPFGNGGAATAAYLGQPEAVAVDKNGNLYIADEATAEVRMVNVSTGIITAVAGTGVGGYNMDGIAATAAQLNLPWAICLDTFNNLYIADQANFRIRKVTASTGMISTVAGTGTGGYTGNNLNALSSKVSYTYGIAVDRPGNIFITDVDIVRKIDVSTGNMYLYAGMVDTASFGGDGGVADSVSKLHSPEGLAVDTAGNLYIADEANDRIREVYKKSVVAVQQIHSPGAIAMSVVPNPNTGDFTIKGTLNTTDDHVKVQVVNLDGQVIYSSGYDVLNGNINIPVSLGKKLPPGCYLLNLTSGDQNEIARFIIQK